MATIAIKGLGSGLRKSLHDFVEPERQKISARIHNEVDVDIHMKKTHNRIHMSVRAAYPGNLLHSHQEGWNVHAMAKDAFEDMLSQIEHRYKGNVREKASTNEFFPEVA
jgi:ribosome-associated translation inhibitor RaiA